ncbi:PREDICTED: heparan-alpha-glucosaminide N-acetyltransferase-like isoform X2 [Lupinus angustifolius]|uniref:heparan-alpha-glucosaminide N-acetyltransferase-like isoform X2 n=1 Tax=Lupinus angustifolius TaxID=3871 RepID=UPI00092E416D|nr:PREDICTED: heparan-alpha-glucosaminide N-acetyltransferase-like isoform X2 [Lupinus angustifolius]
MSSENEIEVAEEERTPLLPAQYDPNQNQNCKNTSVSSVPNQRVASLDVFRGLTVALMILVDDVGKAFPSLNHSPWFGLTLADFVMPFFLFGVGVSIALVFKKPLNKQSATKKVILRTIKLFLLGVLVQGGYFHGRGNLSYGVDLNRIRWLGVLQRISIGYLLASISELWLVNNTILVNSPASYVRKYFIQWVFSLLLCSVYLSLLYSLYVPNWKFEHSNLLGSGLASIIENECSVNSPDYGPLPPHSPVWCLAPFDPEGILSSLMASITCFMGLQFGHILVLLQGHKQRVLIWSAFSFSLLAIGSILQILGIPVSKALYTLSYMFITAGASGLVLTVIYYIVDIEHLRKPTVILQWMGMNALIVYALAACDIFTAVIQGFYWRSPENNLVDATEALLQTIFHSEKWGTLAFVIVEILFWGLFAGFLHKKGIYIKL